MSAAIARVERGSPMNFIQLGVVVACAAAFALTGCGKDESGAAAKPRWQPRQENWSRRNPPYTYPAPVKGHYKEINIGEFDLVDGIAYPAADGSGTVVYVTDKPIASPMLTESACPMTQARVLTKLRNGDYVEVTLDKAGRSKYFAAGTAFGGSSREQDVGGHLLAEQAQAGRRTREGHRRAQARRSFRIRPAGVEPAGQ